MKPATEITEPDPHMAAAPGCRVGGCVERGHLERVPAQPTHAVEHAMASDDENVVFVSFQGCRTAHAESENGKSPGGPTTDTAPRRGGVTLKYVGLGHCETAGAWILPWRCAEPTSSAQATAAASALTVRWHGSPSGRHPVQPLKTFEDRRCSGRRWCT